MADTTVGMSGKQLNPRGSRVLTIGAVVLAVGLQLVVLVPFTIASGLLAPLWAIIALHLLWAACAFLLLRLARRQPLATPLVPVVNAVLLWAALTAGEVWLGWVG